MSKYNYKYHDEHLKKLTEKIKENNFIENKGNSYNYYNPNYSYIWKRSSSAPIWGKQQGHLPLNYDNSKDFSSDRPLFYGNIPNIKDSPVGKSFVDMSKQSQRSLNKEKLKPKEIVNKPIIPNKLNITVNSIDVKKTHKLRPSTASIKNKSNKTNRNNSMKKINLIEEEINSSFDPDDSYELYKDICAKDLKKFQFGVQNRRLTQSTKQRNLNLKKKKIKAIDFDKIITHEYLNRISDSHVAVIPYLLPNYNSIRPAQNCMVVYDQKKHKINKNKTDNLAKDATAVYFNADKILDKINNHKVIHPPNFDLMYSRPDDDDPLPSYMKKIFAKNSCYAMTAQSLKLNNYSNCGFQNSKSSFFPKLSYNKIINLNLLRSKKFLDEVIGDKENLNKKHYYLSKALKFYNKNYEKIMNENYLSRFDCVTYKTIKNDRNSDIQKIISELAEDEKYNE